MPRTPWTTRALCVSAVALVALAGCSSSSPHKAAEPASAPPTTAAPDGTVRSVGADPEGIVYDPGSQLVAVAVQHPYRLQLLDPDTLAVRRTLALPGRVRHLQRSVTGDEILVPDEGARRIIQVPLPSGATTSTAVGRQPHDALRAANGDVVVGNEYSGSISVVRNGAVVKTIADLEQPGGLAADGDTVAVVDVKAYTVSTYSLRTLTRTARVGAGAGPTHVVTVPGGRVAVTDTRGDAVRLFGLSPLRELGHIDLPGHPYGITVDESTGTVWTTLTGRNEVVGLQVRGDELHEIARYPTVRQPNTVAVDPGGHRLWVTGTDAGVVQLIRR